MRYNTEKLGIRPIEIVFFVLGVILLLILATVANGQTRTEAMKVAKAHSQAQQIYREYRGVRLGMTATEVRAKRTSQPSELPHSFLFLFATITKEYSRSEWEPVSQQVSH